MELDGYIGYVGIYEDIKEYIEKTILSKIKDGRSIEIGNSYTIVSKGKIKKENAHEILIEDGMTSEKERKNNTYSTVCLNKDEITFKRDFWGTRMQYYSMNQYGLFFSSEIKLLLMLSNYIDNTIDEISLSQCAGLGYIYDNERTLFKYIKQFERSTINCYKDGKIHTNNVEIMQDTRGFQNFEDASLVFSEAFQNAVNNAMNHKANKVFFLSGGMDSSALVMAARKNYEEVNTLTFTSEANKEDIFFAKKLANCYQTKHYEIPFFNEDALYYIPQYLYDIENVELDGIFSPLGGYSYYLMCQQVKKLGFETVFPGEGADELLGGYYWQFTHTFGFVDKLKEKTIHYPNLYKKITALFPQLEERISYRKKAYEFLKGSALTNYHLSTIEHTAKAFGLNNTPIFMSEGIYSVIKNMKMDWLCDGKTTKIILRDYLIP